MRALDRKLLRDLSHQRSQVLSIALLVACGVMTVVALRSTLASVRDARDAYYRDYRFADVFASLKRAPEEVATRLAALPGVAAVETRVAFRATLDVPGLSQPATALIVSVPATRRSMPNDLHLTRGRYVAADRDDEALVSHRFALANGLEPGDSVGAIINGRWQRLRVVGVAMSPEYIYEMSGAGFMVDNRRFGILWMRREALAAAVDLRGAFNDVAVVLAPGAREQAVIADVDRVLAPYGSVGAIGRADQASNQVIDDELRQLDAIARVFPLFFLGIAAFLLNTVLSRLIATQRTEIGALKALGYSNRTVGWHYLAFGAVAVAVGAVLGMGGGTWLGSAYTGLYQRFFGFPSLAYHTYWSAAAAAIVVSGGSALAGALWAVRAAVRLPPAQAFRPPAPAHFRPLMLERLGLGAGLTPAVRMVLRNLERRPVRTFVSVIGISLATAVLVAGLYPFDSVDLMIDVAFRRSQRDDLSVAFAGPRPARAGRELASLQGVTHVELFRAASVRLRNDARSRTVVIIGYDSGSALRRLVGASGAPHALPSGGVVLTRSLADALGVSIGDTLRAELLELGGEARDVVLAGRLDELTGFGGYMDRAALNRLLREGNVASGAFLSILAGEEDRLYARLKAMPGVAGTSSRQALLDFFERTMAENVRVSGSVVMLAAVIIAVGVIYNSARIAMAERGRELASLRVLGFTRREVSALFLGEQGAITVVGLPLGIWIGFGFAAILARAFANERHRFPLTVETSTYVVAVGVVVAAAAIVALVVRRRVDRLDLIATLKTGE